MSSITRKCEVLGCLLGGALGDAWGGPKYAGQLKEDVEYRREWAERIGLGFVVPRVPQLTVVSLEQHAA